MPPSTRTMRTGRPARPSARRPGPLGFEAWPWHPLRRLAVTRACPQRCRGVPARGSGPKPAPPPCRRSCPCSCSLTRSSKASFPAACLSGAPRRACASSLGSPSLGPARAVPEPGADLWSEVKAEVNKSEVVRGLGPEPAPPPGRLRGLQGSSFGAGPGQGHVESCYRAGLQKLMTRVFLECSAAGSGDLGENWAAAAARARVGLGEGE